MGFSRIVFLQNGLDDTPRTHWLPETVSWKGAVERAGLSWHGFSHVGFDRGQAAGLGLLPVIPFRCDHDDWGYSPERRLAAYRNGMETLPGILQQHYPGDPCETDLLYVAYAADPVMAGLSEWLRGIPPARQPSIALYFHFLPLGWRFDPERASLVGNFTRWLDAVDRLRQASAKVRYFSSLPLLSSTMSRVFREPFKTLGYACQMMSPDLTESVPVTHDIGILGGTRSKQGWELRAELLKALFALERKLTVFMQTADDTRARVISESLGIHDIQRLTTFPGIAAGHLERMASCRLLLIPYPGKYYILRDSGIFTEACVMGKPVVASSITSMGRMIRAGIASGVTYDREDPESIAKAVLQAMQDIENLESKARMLAPEWRKKHSADHILGQTLGSFANA